MYQTAPNRDRNREDLPRPSTTQQREGIAALDQQKDRDGERAQYDRDWALGQNPKPEHHADEYFSARRVRRRRIEQRINRRVRSEQQKRQQHVGQRFGRARRESVSAEHEQKREPSFGCADVRDRPGEDAYCQRCACHDGHGARANFVHCTAGSFRDDRREPVEERRFAVGVAVRIVRYQPVPVAHDTLNPLGGLRLRVLLKRRADSLHENDEGEQRGDCERC